MFAGILDFYLSLPGAAKIILVLLVIGIFFSLLKKTVKFAIYLAVLAVLIILIYKLLEL